MRLQKLTLEHFRNHQKLFLEFDETENITSIVGANAQGKTNILEAIYLLALTKSFRSSHDEDLIGWSEEYARVKGECKRTNSGAVPSATKSSDAGVFSLEVFLGKPPQPGKVLKKNDVKISTSDFIGTCQVVFFHPEDLNMLYLGPDLRRRYIDMINLQINKNYYRSLQSYRRVLKQRNALLHAIKEGRAQRDELQIWDDQLIEHGTFLMVERAKTVQFFQTHLAEYYRNISRANETVTITYEHTLKEDLNLNLLDREAVKSAYQKTLQATIFKDLQAQFTTIGPHRDNLIFSLNDLPLASHASRGEYRSLLLSLKLLELRFFKEQTGDKPLLLLDDVFSELDEHRQKMLLEATRENQTIITATHLHDRPEGRILQMPLA